MSYTSQLNRVHPGAAANTTGNTVFTFNGSLGAGGAVLRAITLVNANTTLKRHVTAYLVPLAGSATVANEVLEVDVAPADTIIVRGPWYENSSAFVVVKVDLGTDLTVRITANEIT